MRNVLTGCALVGIVMYSLIVWRHAHAVERSAAEAVSLHPETEELDCGSLLSGDVPVFRVDLDNRTSAPVDILNVEGSCTCVEAEVSPKLVLPGARCEVSGRLRFGDFLGSARESIVVHSTGGVVAMFRVHANMSHRYVADPVTIDFGHVAWNSPAQRRFVDLIDCSLSPQKLEWSIDAVRPPFSASFTGDRSSKSTQMVVQVNANIASLGAHMEEIIVHTNDIRQPTIHVPVKMNIDPPIQVTPKVLYIGDVKQSESSLFSFAIQAAQGIRISRVWVEHLPAKLKLSVDPKDVDRSSLVLMLDLTEVEGVVQDNLVLETTNPSYKVRVPIVAYVSK